MTPENLNSRDPRGAAARGSDPVGESLQEADPSTIGQGSEGGVPARDMSGLRRRRKSKRSRGLFGFVQRKPDSRRRRGLRSGNWRDWTGAQAGMFFGCILLALLGAGFSGFVFGQRLQGQQKGEATVQTVERIFPSPESAELLNTAFKALQAGNTSEAFVGFQKVQNLQPGLCGIDYLLAMTSMKMGEFPLAEESARRAVSKNEMSAQARILLDLIEVDKTKAMPPGESKGPQFNDPLQITEKDMNRFAAENPTDPVIFAQWADLKRSQGAYQSAVELLHNGVVRSDPRSSYSVLSAKEGLAKLQAVPAKELPSLAEVASMKGERAVMAALAALQLKQPSDALHFLERARDSYAPPEFQCLLLDQAFDDYRKDPQLVQFFKK